MKRNILVIVLAIMAVFNIKAQVIINRNNLPDNGFEGTYAKDTNGIALPASGIGLTWDLSNTLKNNDSYKVKLGANSWYPGYKNYPNANHCITRTDNDSSWQYLKISQSELSSEGVFSISGGVADTNIFHLRLLKFPATYGTKWMDSIKIIGNPSFLGFDIDSTGPLPKVDSLRFDITLNANFNVSGWGLLKTPVYVANALQVTNTQIVSFSVKMKVGAFWLSVPKALLDSLQIVPTKDTSYQVWFWTNDATKAWPLLTYSYAPGDTKASEVEWLQSNNVSAVNGPVANNSGFYPNPVFHTIYFNPNAPQIHMVNIYALEGKLILSNKLLHNSIDISNLNSGVYLLETLDVNGRTLNKGKLIKGN